MTFSTYLDVAISLVFVFFTISMFVSGIVELINAFWEQRSKLLQLALLKILNTDLFTQFWDHPLVKVKRQRYFGADKPISYLSGDSFSTVIIDLLTPANTSPAVAGTRPSKTVLTHLQATVSNPASNPTLNTLIDIVRPILNRSNTLAEFKTNLERWYDGYMEQVSGWYKRYAQGVVWIVAAVVTIAMNVDTIHITKRLFNDKDLRVNLVAQAEKTVQSQTKAPTSSSGNSSTAIADSSSKKYEPNLRSDTVFMTQLGKSDSTLHARLFSGSALTGLDSLQIKTAYVRYLQTNIDALKLPIGWTTAEKIHGFQWVARIFGWLLTIAALSFGAPFWFDLLIKLVNIRNTTRRPQSSVVPDSK